MSEAINSSALTDEDSLKETTTTETTLVPATTISLSEESQSIINEIVATTDRQTARELIDVFNENQKKKTLVRVNKLNDLLDVITDQALARFTQRPDEISNKELFDGLKVVQDLIERGQKQASGVEEAPLIQVNQQTNEVNIGGSSGNLSRDSRERVKTAVLGLLNSITATGIAAEPPIEATDIDEEGE